MSDQQHKHFWERMGRESPYYGALTHEEFQGSALDAEVVP
jgi:hypothetical protein